MLTLVALTQKVMDIFYMVITLVAAILYPLMYLTTISNVQFTV